MILENRYNYSPLFLKKSQDALETALETAPLYKEWSVYGPGREAMLEAKYDALPELTKRRGGSLSRISYFICRPGSGTSPHLPVY